tara:strand:- start:3521 stop:4237 length:717 start_codon:yes stop_codon:yes gene_type:complete
MTFSLDHVIFFGRTWNECLSMYALDERDLDGRRILDCPGGPDALVADGLARGLDIQAVDPQYAFEPDVLEERGRTEIGDSMKKWQEDPAQAWDQKQADEFTQRKLEALDSFISAYRSHRDRFIEASLPELPFEDDAFDLVLSGHFLFLYASIDHGGLMSHGQLDLDFHVKAVRELVRVGREVRIFPTFATTGPARRQPYVEPLMEAIAADGFQVDLVPSNWVEGNFTQFNDLIRITRS